jgi:hypothetical protein
MDFLFVGIAEIEQQQEKHGNAILIHQMNI